MKRYSCGYIEIKNTELLRKELNNIDKDFELVGIQRSLTHLDEYTSESTGDIIFNGHEEIEQNENFITRTYKSCDFELPLFSLNTLVGKALIEGTGKDIRKIVDEEGNEEDLEVYFIINKVTIIKL